MGQTNDIYLVQEVDMQQVVQHQEVDKLLVVQEEDSLQHLVLREVHSLQLRWDCMVEVACPSSLAAATNRVRVIELQVGLLLM